MTFVLILQQKNTQIIQTNHFQVIKYLIMASETNNEEMDCTPPELREIAKNMDDNLLPEKSKNLYMNAYKTFQTWCVGKKVKKTSENVLLAYFEEQAEAKKASTLWAIFSMLKSTIKLRENVDISRYFKLIAFLKKQNKNYVAKKSSVFTKEEIVKFLNEAPDAAFLTAKVIFVVEISNNFKELTNNSSLLRFRLCWSSALRGQLEPTNYAIC